LCKNFEGGVALAGIDILIDTDRTTGITGPNGSGKARLFNVVADAFRLSAGRVTWRGENIAGKRV